MKDSIDPFVHGHSPEFLAKIDAEYERTFGKGATMLPIRILGPNERRRARPSRELSCHYDGAALRALRTERGVGRPPALQPLLVEYVTARQAAEAVSRLA